MSLHDTMNQPGGVIMRHVMDSTNPDENLFSQMLCRSNLNQAWKRVKANKGKPGIDRMSIQAFPEIAKTHWKSIRQTLIDNKHLPAFGGPACGDS